MVVQVEGSEHTSSRAELMTDTGYQQEVKRGLYAVAGDKELPAQLAFISACYRTPWVSVLLTALVALLASW